MAATFTIRGNSEGAVAAAEELRVEIARINKATRDSAIASREASQVQVRAAHAVAEAQEVLARTTVQGGRAVVASEAKKVAALREEITVARQVAASYVKGSDEEAIATQRVTALIQQQTRMLGVNAAAAEKAAGARVASGVLGQRGGRQGTDPALERFGRGAVIGGMGRAAAFGSTAFLGGLLATAGIGKSIEEFREAEDVIERVRIALQNLNIAFDRKAIEAWGDKMMEITRFSDEKMLTSFTSFVRVTKDVGEAQKMAGLAADLARGRNISLEQATSALMRVQVGNVNSLRRLGIEVRPVTKHMDEFRAAHIKVTDANREQVIQLQHQATQLDKNATRTQTMDRLYRQYAGNAAKLSDTARGKVEGLGNQMDELQELIGKTLSPSISRLADAIADFIQKARRSETLRQVFREIGRQMRALGTIIQEVWSQETVRNIGLITAAIIILRRHVILLFAAIRAHPFVAIASAAVIAAELIIAHWDKVRGFFVGLWKFIREGFFFLWDWIKIQALKAYKDILEPFSHLPGRLGHWARVAKTNVSKEIGTLEADMKLKGELAGNAWGEQWTEAAIKRLTEAKPKIGKVMTDIEAQQTEQVLTGPRAPKTALQKGLRETAVEFGPESGIKYHWGGFKPQTGFDCSGYLQYVYKQNGISIPRTSQAQWADPNALKIPKGGLRPGDAVFFDNGSSRPQPDHVGIYIGNDFFIEYYSEGKPAAFGQLKQRRNYMGARRWLKIEKGKGGDARPPKKGGPTVRRTRSRRTSPTSRSRKTRGRSSRFSGGCMLPARAAARWTRWPPSITCG
jgi:hypothetical protein